MGRAKKSEEKPKESKEGPTLQIDVDHFVRTRDSVVSGLATLQDAIQTLSSAYIKHTNTVLVGHGAGLDVDTTLAKLVENPLLKDMEESADRAASPAKSVVVAAESDKKERKKRLHDPNAPKRPLTPFFLYMKTARPIIASDLGPEAAKGAVSTEGTKRWSVMDAHQKYLWGNVYKENLRLYNARMHAYKQGGNVTAKDMTDAEALAYAEEHNIGINPSDVPSLDPAAALPEEEAEAEAEGEAEAEADADADDEPEKEPTPPLKTPKAKNTRRSKGGKNSTPAAAPASPEAIMPPPSASSIAPPKPAQKEKSPEKKRKRGSKKEEEKVVVEEQAVETPKSAPKPRKKKAKADS